MTSIDVKANVPEYRGRLKFPYYVSGAIRPTAQTFYIETEDQATNISILFQIGNKIYNSIVTTFDDRGAIKRRWSVDLSSIATPGQYIMNVVIQQTIGVQVTYTGFRTNVPVTGFTVTSQGANVFVKEQSDPNGTLGPNTGFTLSGTQTGALTSGAFTTFPYWKCVIPNVSDPNFVQIIFSGGLNIVHNDGRVTNGAWIPEPGKRDEYRYFGLNNGGAKYNAVFVPLDAIQYNAATKDATFYCRRFNKTNGNGTLLRVKYWNFNN